MGRSNDRDRGPSGEGASSPLGSFGEFARRRLQEEAGAPAPAPAWIDKFPVVDELGSGTYGRVYRVYDPDLDCFRAAKIPTDVVLASPLLRLEFLVEARNLRRIEDHPNVVRVVQAGEDDGAGRPYFVMEHCPDGSLAAWLAPREGLRGDERWAARLMAQVADGVHWIHRQGLCHRDLKPANVLLVRAGGGGGLDRPDFRPKVADLGLASLLDDPDASASIRTGPVGTLAYMAPEQARGRRREIGPASDVYGLGTILYEVVAGRRPYGSLAPASLLEALQGPRPSPSLREAGVRASSAMHRVVATAMRKDAGHRYATAAAMADDLRRLAEGRPVRGASWRRKALFFLSRHRARIGAAAVLGAAGAVAVEAGRIGAERREAAASAWLRRMETATPREAARLIGERPSGSPQASSRLAEMFEADEPVRKLNAALALAPGRPDCAEHVVDRLLALPPKEVGPIALAVRPAVPDLPARLASAVASPRPARGDVAPASRRRANAALGLFLLGDPRAGSRLFEDLRDPSARSILVHALGPAGVPPATLLGLAAGPSTPAAVRRQALLALGEVAAPSWTEALRDEAVATALGLYGDDPDPGIHGASKWLLRAWGLGDAVAEMDVGLAGQAYRPGFAWRVDPSGLTFVAVDREDGGRFEITDVEVPWRLYRTFAPDFEGPGFGHVLADDEPALGVSFLEAAAFANHFGARAGLPPVFPPAMGEGTVPPASEVVGAPGYRLPTSGEFYEAAQAGAVGVCYFGGLPEFVPEYAFTADNLGVPGVQAVGLLKPNDLGLFDAIGNALELCHYDDPLPNGPRNQVAQCGGSGILPSSELSPAPRHAPGPASRPPIPSGFRLARTLALADAASPGGTSSASSRKITPATGDRRILCARSSSTPEPAPGRIIPPARARRPAIGRS